MPLSQPMKALFIDRDGVINKRRMADYVKRTEEFEFLPEIFEVLPLIHAAGYLAIVITNQRGIGRGLMSEADLEEIHRSMQHQLHERTGHGFDAIYHCPHDHADSCACRKPLPGMILQAASRFDIDLASSWMIGDSESDIDAGIAAGCRTVRIHPPGGSTRADLTAESLAGAWERIAGYEPAQPAR